MKRFKQLINFNSPITREILVETGVTDRFAYKIEFSALLQFADNTSKVNTLHYFLK